jgi:hypothetical protein
MLTRQDNPSQSAAKGRRKNGENLARNPQGLRQKAALLLEGVKKPNLAAFRDGRIAAGDV